MELFEIEGVEGIISFDGRVLEYFAAGDRSDDWRVHVAHVINTEVEPRKDIVLFKAFTTTRHYHGALVPDARVGALDELRARLEERRGA